jgi:hypothetical protein
MRKGQDPGGPKTTDPKDPDADPEHWYLDEETGVRIPDGELSSRVVRQLLNLGGEEGVDHKHQRFRVPTYREKTKTNVFSVNVQF